MIDWNKIRKLAAMIFSFVCVAFLLIIWAGGAHRELVWFMVPIAGLLRMIGGTWWKVAGRFIAPAMPAAAMFFFTGWSWWIPLCYLAYMGIKTLPVTLIGNSIHDSWFNWIWIWLLGAINGVAALTLGIPYAMISTALFLMIVPTVVYGLTITLSNVKPTAKFFPWKMCEFLMGSSVMIPPAMLIDLKLLTP